MKHVSRHSYMLLILFMAGLNFHNMYADGFIGYWPGKGTPLSDWLPYENTFSRYNRCEFHKDGILSELVQDIFGYCEESISSLEEAEKFVQKHHLLHKDEQREKQTLTPLQKMMIEWSWKLLHTFYDLGMMNATPPFKRRYTYGLLMGSSSKEVTLHLDHLAELQRHYGCYIKYLVLLSSDRPLSNEEKEGLPADISTEIQMMEYLCEVHQHFKREKVYQINGTEWPQGAVSYRSLILVNVPMVERKDGMLVYPTTDDALAYFAQIKKLYSFNGNFIMHSSKKEVALRLDDLAKSEKRYAGSGAHYHYPDVVLVGSDRPLSDEDKEGFPAVPADISTEIQLMEYLCKSHPHFKDRIVCPVNAIEWPLEAASPKSIILVNVPMIKKENGTLVCPTTYDLHAYYDPISRRLRRVFPLSSTCLVIANAPYTQHYTKAAQRILDQSRLPTEGTGREILAIRADMEIFIDEFARTLHEEYLAFVKSKTT